ncbi:MAG TPA: ABC transporter permease [Sphingomicrobium sp.]|nr:ABC transporter permease [Sphingomicrobium sp.]
MTSAPGRAGRQAPAALGSGVFASADVIAALVRRDIQSRLTGNFLGFGWTYVVPLVWIAGTYFAFYLFGRRVPVYTDTITFIISGLVPYIGFRYAVNAVSRTNAAMQRLLIFPTVKLEHGVVSSALLEWVNVFVVFALVAALNALLFGNGEMDDPLRWVFGTTLACALGASYAYFFVALTEIRPGFRQLGIVLLRPAFFISGIFFTSNELPERVLPLFLWNPLLHAVEISRSGMLDHYEARAVSAAYPLAWIAGMIALAAAVRLTQRN